MIEGILNDAAEVVLAGATAGLVWVTWALVRVTKSHAHHAEKMAAAADRLDLQVKALTDALELHALVSATAAIASCSAQLGARDVPAYGSLAQLEKEAQRRYDGSRESP